MIQAVLLSQGNELTTGQTVDTNAAWLSEQLWELGIEVRRMMTVPDRVEEICAVLEQALSLAPVIICTGGLGPTRDDLTAQALSQVLDSPLVQNSEALDQIQAMFQRLGREMSDSNRKQALIPACCSILPNGRGTAPGIVKESEALLLCCLPGVPHEMRAMFGSEVLPRLQRFRPEASTVRHIIRVLGVPESRLEDQLADLAHPGLEISFRASVPSHQVKLRFHPSIIQSEREECIAQVRERIGPRAFGVDCGDLASVVGALLRDRDESLALAESCTSGRLASWVTSIPGASAYLMEGAVVYSNEAKIRCCGVSPALIDTHGAVSEPVAVALASGIRERADTTWGVGITGIAGPGGARPGKPVGTVHIAVCGPHTASHRRLQLSGDRSRVIQRSTAEAMYQLYRAICESA